MRVHSALSGQQWTNKLCYCENERAKPTATPTTLTSVSTDQAPAAAVLPFHVEYADSPRDDRIRRSTCPAWSDEKTTLNGHT